MERLHDSKADIEAYEISNGQGAHGVIHAEACDFIDILFGCL
jgi:hypothetical protein